MNNFNTIINADDLNHHMLVTTDKVVIFFYFSKHIPDCRKAAPTFKRSSSNHSCSIFLVIDTDQFKGECRYYTPGSIRTLPSFECYYGGSSIASCGWTNENDFEKFVMQCEQYSISKMHANAKNIGPNNKQQQQAAAISDPMIEQVSQQLLNMARTQDIRKYNQWMSDPTSLTRDAMKYIQLQQQQQQQQQQRQAIPSPLPNLTQPQMQQQLQQLQTLQQLQQVAPTTSEGVMTVINQIVPNIQQMQYMFKIFQMLQQMGVLQIATGETSNVSNVNDANGIKILPNGDKLVPLANGKWGLIKRKK